MADAAEGRRAAAPKGALPAMAYLAHGRLDRRKANLIQTLHTVQAFGRLGHRVALHLPWVPRATLERGLADVGIDRTLEIRRTPALRLPPVLELFLHVNRSRLRSTHAAHHPPVSSSSSVNAKK